MTAFAEAGKPLAKRMEAPTSLPHLVPLCALAFACTLRRLRTPAAHRGSP